MQSSSLQIIIRITMCLLKLNYKLQDVTDLTDKVAFSICYILVKFTCCNFADYQKDDDDDCKVIWWDEK